MSNFFGFVIILGFVAISVYKVFAGFSGKRVAYWSIWGAQAFFVFVLMRGIPDAYAFFLVIWAGFDFISAFIFLSKKKYEQFLEFIVASVTIFITFMSNPTPIDDSHLFGFTMDHSSHFAR